MTELERQERLQRVTAGCYALALRSASDYAVELDRSDVESFRGHLKTLRESLSTATEPEEFESIQSSFRGELRDYRDRTQERIEKMRADVQAAAEAMQSVANEVTSRGDDHEAELRADLQKLSDAAEGGDLEKIRAVVRETVASIGEGYRQMRSSNQLAIAQLHDEIRSLHRQMDQEQRTLHTDESSGAWNRKKIEGRIEDLAARKESFCVVLMWLRDLRPLLNSQPRRLIAGLLHAFVKRTAGILGTDAMVGRWSETEFAVILDSGPEAAMALSAVLARQLSARYAVQDDGTARHLSLHVSSGVIEYPAETGTDAFQDKLEQLSFALEQASAGDENRRVIQTF